MLTMSVSGKKSPYIVETLISMYKSNNAISVCDNFFGFPKEFKNMIAINSTAFIQIQSRTLDVSITAKYVIIFDKLKTNLDGYLKLKICKTINRIWF